MTTGISSRETSPHPPPHTPRGEASPQSGLGETVLCSQALWDGHTVFTFNHTLQPHGENHGYMLRDTHDSRVCLCPCFNVLRHRFLAVMLFSLEFFPLFLLLYFQVPAFNFKWVTVLVMSHLYSRGDLLKDQ